VIYALAGRIDIDLEREPVGFDKDGVAVYMRDLLPPPDELEASMKFASDPGLFSDREDSFDPAVEAWRSVAESGGSCFAWNPESHYLVEPPFFADNAGDPNPLVRRRFQGARVLAAFGDSLTTDHVSPGGEIPADTPAGRYLLAQGIAAKDFNTYVARRGNHHVMTRATFANIRVRNALVEGTEGGFTRHFPDGRVMTIFDAAQQYRDEHVPTIVLAGRDYGTGSSRDWAAKGTALLGVVAVIAESYERIHRANLVGMGVVPLIFRKGEGWRQLGLSGDESFDFEGMEEGVASGSAIHVIARRPSGEEVSFEVTAAVLTASEQRLMAEGGIPRSVLSEFTEPQLAH
jgi:aconitate hydratase